MLPIALVAGVVIGVSLGALGGGGSILTVPVLVYALNQQPQPATTASLVIVGITSVTAAIGHARAGRVQWPAAAIFGVLGVAASLGGSMLNRVVNPQALLLAFAALMLVAAVALFARTRNPAADDTRPPRPAPKSSAHNARARVRIVVTAIIVGFLTGFLGVGGGFLIVPALVLAMGFAMPTAVGTSLVVISVTSLGAFTERLGHGTIPWAVVVPFTLAAIAGSLLGKRLSDRVSGTTLTRSFATLLVRVAGYVVVQAGARI